MPAQRNRTSRLSVLPIAIALAFAIVVLEHSVVAGDDKRDDDWSTTTVTRPPDGGFWYKIIVHHCLPKTAVTMHYAIDRASGTPYKNETEKFEDMKNSYQSVWIPMEEGGFSLETVEFLDDKGKVVLAIPYTNKETTLPFRFELTKEVPASAIALPAQKEHGKCEIVR